MKFLESPKPDPIRRLRPLPPPGRSHTRRYAHVRIDGPTYKALLAHFESIACHRSPENLARELATIPFARYAPIRRQLLMLVRKVNQARQRMGYQALPHSVPRLRRMPVKVYRADSTKPDEEVA